MCVGLIPARTSPPHQSKSFRSPHTTTTKVSSEESTLASEISTALKVNAKDAAKAAKVLAGEDLGLTSVDQLGTLEKEHVDLVVTGLSVNGKKALLRRYEELAGGGAAVSHSPPPQHQDKPIRSHRPSRPTP